MKIVGESHYQKELSAICGGRCFDGHRVPVVATLIYEDDNPYDDQAIRVDIDDWTVGYLSREDARIYRRALSKAWHRGWKAQCQAIIVGGWDRGGGDRGYFGVRLDLPSDD